MPATAEFRLSPQRGVAVQRFRNFLAVVPPPPYTKLKIEKNSGYIHPTLFVVWGKGLDLCEVENTQKCKSVPRLLSMILNKSPWDNTAIIIFLCYFSVPSLNSSAFSKFCCSSPSPTLYKVETRKKFWIHASNIVCGVRGGVGPVWIGKRPRNAKVSQDFCPWL